MADTSTLRAIGAPLEPVDEAQSSIEQVALDVLATKAFEAGITLPEGFMELVAGDIRTRARRPLLSLTWTQYRAGIERGKLDQPLIDPSASRPPRR